MGFIRIDYYSLTILGSHILVIVIGSHPFKQLLILIIIFNYLLNLVPCCSCISGLFPVNLIQYLLNYLIYLALLAHR